MRSDQDEGSAGFGVPLLTTALLIMALVGAGIPALLHKKSRAREAQLKSNLHEIQLQVERFHTDRAEYPAWLLGGELASSSSLPLADPPQPPGPVPLTSSDPLLREGYFVHYPTNPFVQQPRTGLSTQEMLRFGRDGRFMGNLLSDDRFPRYSYANAQGQSFIADSGARFGYAMWGDWGADPALRTLQGNFFYKSAGEVLAPLNDESWELPPEHTESYMLGAYALDRQANLDVLGPDQIASMGNGEVCHTHTGSSMVEGEYLGSPYHVGIWREFSFSVIQGNEDGVPDGVILLLKSDDGSHSDPGKDSVPEDLKSTEVRVP